MADGHEYIRKVQKDYKNATLDDDEEWLQNWIKISHILSAYHTNKENHIVAQLDHSFIYDWVNSLYICDTSAYKSSPYSFNIYNGFFPKLSAISNASIPLFKYHSIIYPWQNMHDFVNGVYPPIVCWSGFPPSFTNS